MRRTRFMTDCGIFSTTMQYDGRKRKCLLRMAKIDPSLSAVGEAIAVDAALDKTTAVLPPAMQEAIMEEMEAKQALKHPGKHGSKKHLETATSGVPGTAR
jgi:hypothetical protein